MRNRQRHAVSHPRATSLVGVLAFSLILAALPVMPAHTPTPGVPNDVASGSQPAHTATNAEVAQQARVAYGQLGVSFEENRGQADERVEFIGRDGGATVFLTNDAAWFVLSAPVERAGGETQSRDGESHESGSGENVALTEDQRSPDALVRRGRSVAADEPRRMHAVRMEIEGANTHTEVVGERELEGRLNYFRGNDPSRWQTDVKTYGAVRYRGIYEGIDLVYYGNERGEMEYDFQVAPGADAGQISLRVEGA